MIAAQENQFIITRNAARGTTEGIIEAELLPSLRISGRTHANAYTYLRLPLTGRPNSQFGIRAVLACAQS